VSTEKNYVQYYIIISVTVMAENRGSHKIMKLPQTITRIDDKSNVTVYVAMSGGVDSSTSAALLADARFDVVGCFMTVWQPPFLDCSMETDRQDAMRVAAELGIPFKTVDLADAYKDRIVDYMIKEYEAGRTPNPDVMCNGEIKFGAFYEWAKKEGADYVATGHYVRRTSTDTKSMLLRGKDARKDQSYFLWQLNQENLTNTLFPVGHLPKPQVRDLAESFAIPVADKDDSQGLCFLGEVDMEDFLSEFIELTNGDVLNESGDVIGTHKGSEVYTIGQRRGFTVTDKAPDSGPWYVIDKDTDANTITVSEDNSQTGPVFNGKEVYLTGTNWIAELPDTDQQYEAQIRYNQPAQQCRVNRAENGTWKVVFEQPLRAVAAGQSCVVYDDDMCLGGGIISSTA
jgi:tRNA-specific 2-thiouridylase